MALHQLQIEGEQARQVVRCAWPAATSCYTGPTEATIYDASSGTVLGVANRNEYSVEAAWVAAQRELSNPAP